MIAALTYSLMYLFFGVVTVQAMGAPSCSQTLSGITERVYSVPGVRPSTVQESVSGIGSK